MQAIRLTRRRHPAGYMAEDFFARLHGLFAASQLGSMSMATRHGPEDGLTASTRHVFDAFSMRMKCARLGRSGSGLG